MTLALAGAVAVVIVLGAFSALWRRGVSEQHSLRHYEQALDTLRTVSDRMEPPRGIGPVHRGPPRLHIGDDGDNGDNTYDADDPPNGDTTTVPRPPGPLVFSDENDGPMVAAATVGRPTGSLRPPNRMDRYRSPERPGLPMPQILGAVLVIIVIVVAVTLVTGGTKSPARAHDAAKPSTRPAHGAHPAPPPAVTTTSTPLGQPLASPAATPYAASYAAPAGGYTVTLVATGACWVDAVDTETSQGIWAATMEPGDSKVINAASGIKIEFGSVGSEAVTINGRAVQFPAGYVAGFAMTFLPPASSTTTSTTAASTSTTAASTPTTAASTSTTATTAPSSTTTSDTSSTSTTATTTPSG